MVTKMNLSFASNRWRVKFIGDRKDTHLEEVCDLLKESRLNWRQDPNLPVINLGGELRDKMDFLSFYRGLYDFFNIIV
jgi:hypothetical protein